MDSLALFPDSNTSDDTVVHWGGEGSLTPSKSRSALPYSSCCAVGSAFTIHMWPAVTGFYYCFGLWLF